MNLVHHQRIGGENVSILEPAPRDARGHDDDVPARRFRRRLALPIHNPDPQPGFQDLLGDRSNRERFPRAGAGDDAEALATAGELSYASAVMAFEKRFDV